MSTEGLPENAKRWLDELLEVARKLTPDRIQSLVAVAHFALDRQKRAEEAFRRTAAGQNKPRCTIEQEEHGGPHTWWVRCRLPAGHDGPHDC
jgi:hypothetical protein